MPYVFLTEDQIDIVSSELADANAAEQCYLDENDHGDDEERAEFEQLIELRDDAIDAINTDEVTLPIFVRLMEAINKHKAHVSSDDSVDTLADLIETATMVLDRIAEDKR